VAAGNGFHSFFVRGFTRPLFSSPVRLSLRAIISALIGLPHLPMSLRIIATGGTFDKRYDLLTGQLVFGESVIAKALARARVTVPISFQPLFALDSLDMQDRHRDDLLAACQQSPEARIVIIHGTDTMQQSAEVLGRAALPSTIVLAGAMVPYEIDNSDALFNLGYAMAAATLCPPGVTIAMNGRLFPWDDVIKNRAAGVFEPRG